MESIPLRKKILETIVSKSTLKQKVFDNTFATFNDLKETLLEMASEMDDQLDGLLDRRVRLEYRDRGKFEAQIQVANDLLIFQMHTDVSSSSRTTSSGRIPTCRRTGTTPTAA